MTEPLYQEKYGAWAGHPEGHPPDHTRCCEEITYYVGRWPKHKQCDRKRGHGPEGAYCKQHDPEVVAKRRSEKDQREREKWNERRYEFYGKSFFKVLEQIAAGHNDARGLAQETIAKFKPD